ncbi:MAG: hypothetical protein L6262_01780 [Weeksellaceae bacterium]|nr:hypothetical protein [Weeksellaceae bacterium]
MKKGIIYLLMSIFLLFTVENKQTLDLHPDFPSRCSQGLSLAKKHHIDKSLEKAAFQPANDSLDAPEESHLQLKISDSPDVIVLCALSFGYLLHRDLGYKKQIFVERNIVIQSIKRYLLLRSIRI